MEDLYTLDEIIEVLETVRKDGDGYFNIPKAFYCFALEIKSLKEKLNDGK